MTVRVAIDLNVRVNGGQAYAGLEDVEPPGAPIGVGGQVTVFERETGIEADATVTGIDQERGLVCLAVDWGGFRDDPEAADDPSCE